MSQDVLLKFLSNGLIDVGGDDDKLGHLRQTAVDLAAVLEKAPAKVTPFALVAFDPDAPTTDPTIVEVEETLRQRWETYVNTFAETPVAVFRAILLDALIAACDRNDRLAAAVAASARNVLPLMEVGGERDIWASIVADIERKVDERAEREWATPASVPIPDIRFPSSSTTKIRIASKKMTTTNLEAMLMAAAGPEFNSPERGTVATEGNPHWAHSDPHNWNYEFGRRTAQALEEAITVAIGGLSVEGVDLPETAKNMTEVISQHLTATEQAVSGATAALQRRTNLLWWKEARFSPSARLSYRKMSPFEAAVLMAFDMHRHIPTFSPTSVVAFLWETVIGLPTIEEDKEFPIRHLVDKTRDTSILAELRTQAGNLVAAPAGRGSILGLVGHPEVALQIDDHRFRNLVGVKPDTMLTLPGWSVWLFRELQAARAIKEASASKPRTSGTRAPRN